MKAAAEAVAGRGEDGKEEEGGAEEKDAAAATVGSGGGSRPRKTLPGMDPEEALSRRKYAQAMINLAVLEEQWDLFGC